MWTKKTNIVSVCAVPCYSTHIEHFQGPMKMEFWQNYDAWESSKTQSECKVSVFHPSKCVSTEQPPKATLLLESNLIIKQRSQHALKYPMNQRTLSQPLLLGPLPLKSML